jgi:hypothetical protein
LAFSVLGVFFTSKQRLIPRRVFFNFLSNDLEDSIIWFLYVPHHSFIHARLVPTVSHSLDQFSLSPFLISSNFSSVASSAFSQGSLSRPRPFEFKRFLSDQTPTFKMSEGEKVRASGETPRESLPTVNPAAEKQEPSAALHPAVYVT